MWNERKEGRKVKADQKKIGRKGKEGKTVCGMKGRKEGREEKLSHQGRSHRKR